MPDELLAHWKEWIDSLSVLPELRIPRAIFPTSAPSVDRLTLHVFSDASDEACAAVAYIVTLYQDIQQYLPPRDFCCLKPRWPP